MKSLRFFFLLVGLTLVNNAFSNEDHKALKNVKRKLERINKIELAKGIGALALSGTCIWLLLYMPWHIGKNQKSWIDRKIRFLFENNILDDARKTNNAYYEILTLGSALTAYYAGKWGYKKVDKELS